MEICPQTETELLRFFVCETLSVTFRTAGIENTTKTADFILFPLLGIRELFCERVLKPIIVLESYNKFSISLVLFVHFPTKTVKLCLLTKLADPPDFARNI